MEGEGIPVEARIVAVADVYDALRSERPYKRAYSHPESLEIMASEVGRHEGIGRDIVAHCTNDILCLGARPVGFMDYIAFGRLERGSPPSRDR